METQNAHKHVLVVAQISHSLDILDMCMLAEKQSQLSTAEYIKV